MITDKSIVTVDDVCRLALPLGTIVVAGGDSTTRPVRWAVAAAAESPLPYLEGSELVLLLPGKTDLTALIRACIEANVAAIATLTVLPPLALSAAESAHLPALQLPSGTRVRDVERAVIGLLLKSEDHIERRSTQIYQQLIQLASENVGLEKIVHEMARYINKAVVVQDKRLRLQVVAVPPELAADWEEIAELLGDLNQLPDLLSQRHRLTPPAMTGVSP